MERLAYQSQVIGIKKKLWIYLGVKAYIKNDTFFMLRNIETVLWHVNLTPPPPQSFAGQGGGFSCGLVWFGLVRFGLVWFFYLF